MVKDISADERYQYNQEISSKERQLNDYKAEEKNLLEAIESYQETMTKSFSTLESLNQELVEQGSRPARLDMDANQEMRRFVKTMVDNQKEGVSETYSKLQQEAEDEVESLQRKRDDLPWEEVKTDKKE